MKSDTDCTVRVTGASGFIGRHAQAYLLDMGFTVRVLLRSKTMLRTDSNPKLQKYFGNITDAESLEKACKLFRSFRKTLENSPTLAIRGVDTAENEPAVVS